MFSELDADNKGIQVSRRPLLQSLGNSLLVHANDLQRQLVRQNKQKARAADERNAVDHAFRMAPAVLYEQMLAGLAAWQGSVGGKAAATAPHKPNPQIQQLKVLELQYADAARQAQLYRDSLAGLTAAYRTLANEPGKPLANPPPASADTAAAERDRKAVANLYPATPLTDADKTDSGALAALRQWLNLERSAGLVPDRKTRLALTLDYIETEKTRLLVGSEAAASKAELLKIVKQRLEQNVFLAARQLDDTDAQLKELKASIGRTTAELNALDSQYAATQAALADAAKVDAERQRVAALLALARQEVLAQADAAQVSEAAGFKALLKNRLASLVPSKTDGLPSAQDIVSAQAFLSDYTAPAIAPCQELQRDAQGNPLTMQRGCAGETQIDVVDGLIASLRAQRVQALARGDAKSSDNLLAAINVAYEQRTAMIYLRPASDYLRSVHSASDLQDAADPQYRNMLTEWVQYLFPEEIRNRNDRDSEKRKRELDKLFWQNVNTVTVGGGGFTNFVLAKDDVGNWYVKAYSSDPEAIVKSATSLAMFNAGSRLNVNLMERYNLQTRIDATTDSTEKSALRTQLSEMNSQDGRPLLALRNRYAKRYDDDTRDSALKLLDSLAGMTTAISRRVDDAQDKKTECKNDDLKQGLAALDKDHLEIPRKQLAALVQPPFAAAEAELTVQREKALQAALIALHVYAGKVFRSVDESPAADCEPVFRRGLATSLRNLPRSHLLAVATAHRAAAERYEDALMGITDVATQK